MIKRLLIYALVVVGVMSCKSRVSPEDPQNDPNEIIVTAVSDDNKQSNVQGSRVSIPDAFGEGSYAGLYTCLKADGSILQANSRYGYNIPTWSPEDKTQKLRYHETDEAIYIYGYHPHDRTKGTTTSVSADQTNVSFGIRKNQSTSDSLQLSDLMWAAATGVAPDGSTTMDGYHRQGKPIDLLFRHKLCKLNFRLKIIDTKPFTNSPNKVILQEINLKSSDFALNAVLDVRSGILTNIPVATIDSVYWRAPGSYANGDYVKGGGLLMDVYTDVDAVVVVPITDMIVMPFVATNGGSSLNFKFEIDGHPVAFQKKIDVYSGNSYPSAPSGNKMRFEQNDYNQFTVTIDVSRDYVMLDAKIAAWSDGNAFELETDRN